AWLLSGTLPEANAANPDESNLRQALGRLADELQAPDPVDRPRAPEVLRRLDSLASPQCDNLDPNATQLGAHDAGIPHTTEIMPQRLGRFRITGKLGQGGMGVVYRAEDMTDGTVAAVKVLKPELARNPKSMKRFEKEARMLAAVRNLYVVNLLDVNQE